MQTPLSLTPYDLAARFIGIKEKPGGDDNPLILAMLRLDGTWPAHDEVPWCSAFVNAVCWLAGVPRSKRLNARSWLDVGRPVAHNDVERGFDVVVLRRGNNPLEGHVGFFAGWFDDSIRTKVLVLGGNQTNSVSVEKFDLDRVLEFRRLVS